jgi:hypothetical protein
MLDEIFFAILIEAISPIFHFLLLASPQHVFRYYAESIIQKITVSAGVGD